MIIAMQVRSCPVSTVRSTPPAATHTPEPRRSINSPIRLAEVAARDAARVQVLQLAEQLQQPHERQHSRRAVMGFFVRVPSIHGHTRPRSHDQSVNQCPKE